MITVVSGYKHESIGQREQEGYAERKRRLVLRGLVEQKHRGLVDYRSGARPLAAATQSATL
jgi:hypothetical protein